MRFEVLRRSKKKKKKKNFTGCERSSTRRTRTRRRRSPRCRSQNVRASHPNAGACAKQRRARDPGLAAGSGRAKCWEARLGRWTGRAGLGHVLDACGRWALAFSKVSVHGQLPQTHFSPLLSSLQAFFLFNNSHTHASRPQLPQNASQELHRKSSLHAARRVRPPPTWYRS